MEIQDYPTRHAFEEKTYPPIRGWWGGKDSKPPRPCLPNYFIVSPYDGYCPMDCSFCFQNNPRYDRHSGDRVTMVRKADIESGLPKKLDSLQFAFPTLLNYFSEPFNTLENEYNLTLKAAYQLVIRGLPIVFMTRMAIPDLAVDYLKINTDSFIQYSLNTPNDDILRKMCPKTSLVSEILDQAEKLSESGVFVSLRIDPIIPGITSLSDIFTLIDMALAKGVRHFTLSFLKVGNRPKIIIDKICSNFPDKYEILLGTMTQYVVGWMTARDEYRVGTIEKIVSYIGNRASVSLCREFLKTKRGGKVVADNLNTIYMKGAVSCSGKPSKIYVKVGSGGEVFKPLTDCGGVCSTCTDVNCGSLTARQIHPLRGSVIKSISSEVYEAKKLGMLNIGIE